MKSLRLVLGDQLTRELSALVDLDPTRDVVLLAEVMGEATYVRHHRQKIALTIAAMRHFADALRAEGIRVDYVTLDAPHNSHSLGGELMRVVRHHQPDRVILTEAGEWRLDAHIRALQAELPCTLEIRNDDRFFLSRAEFAAWAQGR
ncbi:MAG: cryptochrome/photolyase family protein, partial [Rhizomicrobium sp.]